MNIVGIIIDVVLVAILLIYAVIGLKKGFLKSVLSLFSWVVCLLIAIFTAKYVALWVNSMFDFAGWIGGGIAQGLEGMNEFFKITVGEYVANPVIPEAVSGIIKTITSMALGNVDLATVDPSTPLSSVVGSGIGLICLMIICGILIFVILKIVIKLLSKLFDNISRTRILGGVNRVLGVLFGLVKGAVMVFLINGLLVALSMIPAVNTTITPIIQDHTYVEKFVYNTTDNLVEKYVIEGEVVQNWLEGVWNAR